MVGILACHSPQQLPLHAVERATLRSLTAWFPTACCDLHHHWHLRTAAQQHTFKLFYNIATRAPSLFCVLVYNTPALPRAIFCLPLTTIATAAALVTRYFNAHTNIMLLRVSRDHYETLWSSMTLMSSFDRRPCALRVVHLSGTIRSSQKHLLAFQQRALKRMVRDASNPGKCCE